MTKARIAGWLLLAAILLSIATGLGLGVSGWVPGTAFWLAGMLLAPLVNGLQRTQTLAMFAVGVAGLLYAWASGGVVQLDKALSTNQALLAMLAAVSLVRLISLPEVDAGEADPRGRAALWRTLLGVHLFGSVINLSAVMILGERQSRRQPMTPLQASVLSRGFALCAHWSPFFAAMGIALSNAPGARLPTLSTVGLPIAALGLLISGWRLSRWPNVDDYVGYPMHFGALRIPALLAVMALGLTVMVLLFRDAADAPTRLGRHVPAGLPRMAGELVLFLAAGVLAAGIASALQSSGWTLDLRDFGATEASLLLLLMVAVSTIGVHPVISIATAHGLLAPRAPDPNLMGITYLMSWAAGVSSSPFSGMCLAMHGRFGIDSRGFVRWNGPFTLFMLAVDAIVLHLYQWIAG
jgi:hypothetical protein